MNPIDSGPAAANTEALARLGRDCTSAPSEVFGGALDAALTAARAAWPEVRLADCDFARHLAERLPPATWAQGGASAACTTDLFLACACSRGDAAALHYLETRFLTRLTRSLSRIDPRSCFSDEVLQSLRRKLLMPGDKAGPRILEYSGRGPLSGWLRAAAVRIALNLRESGWREQELDSALERGLVAGAVDPERTLLKEQLQSHFKEALGQALGSLSPEERNLMRLHLVEGLSIDRLAVMFQIHRSTAARRFQRLRALLLERTRLRLAEAAGLSNEELDSAMTLVRSGVDASVLRLLA